MTRDVNSYLSGKNNIQNSDLIAVLGLNSHRVSRLHHMFEQKTENLTDTAETSYAPKYSNSAENSDDIHEHSEVIVWLGNNGKLTLPLASGIEITKNVTKLADGAASNKSFEIRVLLDMQYTNANTAKLFIANSNGDALDNNKYAITKSGNNTLVTLYLADSESAVIMGAPSGTAFTVSEAEHEKYNYTYTGANQTVAGEIVKGTVINTPIVSGSLYITKEVNPYKKGEPFPTDYEFAFKVTFKDKNGNPIKNKEFELENNYDPDIDARSTDANGVMTGWLRHGETVHILGIPDGATVTVEEVELPTNGNYTIESYRSRNHSGDTPDNDGTVTISSENNATVVVKNTYTPKSTSARLDLSIKKTLKVDTKPSDDRFFTFKLEKWNETEKSWDELKTQNNIGWSSEQIIANEKISTTSKMFTDSLGTFTEAGIYTYQIYEDIPDNRISGMTYDRTVYTITVTVKDVNGQLVSTAISQDGKPVTDIDNDGDLDFTAEFFNTENTATISIDIEKHVTDTSKNPEISKSGFEFIAQTAVVNDGVWSVKPENEGGRSFSVYSDGVGEARMTDIYREPGSYYYIISEKDGGKNGWSYSDVQYRVTVVVTKDNSSNNLTADMSIEKVNGTENEKATVTEGTKGKMIFENTYNPNDTQLGLNTLVKKELDGRNIIADEFTFAIFKNDEVEIDANGNLKNIDKALATGKNDNKGNVTFTPDKLTFSAVGKYEYDIVEVKGDKGGVTYDAVKYDLVVEITDDDQNGALEINYYFEDSVDKSVTFKNIYTVTPVDAVINGIKSLKINSGNKTLHAGDYTFGLYDESGSKIAETSNLANGTFKFDAIRYDFDDIGKTYTYTVREIAPDGSTNGSYVENGVKWSAQSFTVTVKINDNGDGTLSTVINGNGIENIAFVNEYTSNPVNVVLPAKKELNNRQLVVGEFKFVLYETDRHFENPTLKADNITHDANGDFNIDLGRLGEGRHYFLLKEVIPTEHAKGIHYSAAEYHITVIVTDNGTGQMSYTKTIVNIGAPDATDSDIIFTNVYLPEPDEIPLFGTKTYIGGKTLEDDAFSVGLYDNENELLQTAPIKANGNFAFQNLRYSATDVGKTYTYTIKEIIPSDATDSGDNTFKSGNIIYDGTAYTLKVEITDDDKDGNLEIEQVLTKGGATANEISFTNTFVPDTITYDIQAKKTYEKGLKGGDFQFRLLSADNKTNVDQTKENALNGDIIFDSITFTKEGEYKFTLSEKKDSILSFILPSSAEYEITVTVVNENGILRISDVATVNTKNTGETNLEFINTYFLYGEDEITLSGSKKLTGDRTQVNADEFEFGLYDAEGKLVESVKNDANGNFAFGTLKFDETDVPVNGQKQITYTVKEIKGSDTHVTYDETVYTVVVTVKDNDQGGVTASYTVNGEQDVDIEFTNIYTSDSASGPVSEPEDEAKPETEIKPESSDKSDNESDNKAENDSVNHMEANTGNSDIPQTGENSNLHLWFALLFVSGGRIFGTAIQNKKKRKTN